MNGEEGCLSSSICSPTAGCSQALKVGVLDGRMTCIHEQWLPLLERMTEALLENNGWPDGWKGFSKYMLYDKVMPFSLTL